MDTDIQCSLAEFDLIPLLNTSQISSVIPEMIKPHLKLQKIKKIYNRRLLSVTNTGTRDS